MSFAKTSALIINKKLSSHFLILLLVSVLIQLWPVFLTQPARFAVRIAICNALLLVCAAAIFRSLPGKMLAFFLTALLTLNFAIAYSTWSVYQSEFNTVFAMSILGTHVAEAKSMSGLYLHCLPAAFAYFIVTWFAIKAAREGANKRGNSSRLTQSFHFFMFEPIFSPVNALNQPI